jgi:hypothetical protein
MNVEEFIGLAHALKGRLGEAASAEALARRTAGAIDEPEAETSDAGEGDVE